MIETLYSVRGRLFDTLEEAEKYDDGLSDLARHICISAHYLPKKRWYMTERDWLVKVSEELASRLIHLKSEEESTT